MRLTKEEEEGFLVLAEKCENAAEECALSLFGRFLSNKSYNLRAIREEGLHASNARFDHIHLWVQLWGLPFDLISKPMVQEIGDRIGTCVKIDERLWSSDQAHFMRIRMELEIQKPLRRRGMVISPKVEEFQYGDWLRASRGNRGMGSRRNPPRSEKEGGGSGVTSQKSAGEDLHGASVKESINGENIEGHSFRDNVSNIAGLEGRLFSKFKTQTEGEEIMDDVPDKDASSTIPLSDSNRKIFGATCMGLERNVYEDNNTPVEFKQGGTKPKTKATWKRL
ncbi:hypothetical protein FCV25MIE_17892 [Fagus crenata]